VGALLSGILADTLGISSAMLVIAALTFLSGIIVATVMYETLPARHIPALPQNPIALIIHPKDPNETDTTLLMTEVEK
jgi:hypothetical protein